MEEQKPSQPIVTISSSNPQGLINIGELIVEKATNFVNLAFDSTIMKGELLKKFNEVGKQALLTIIVQEVMVGSQVLVGVLQQRGWTYEKLESISKNPKEIREFLEICKKLLDDVSGKETKIEDTVQLKPEIENDPKLCDEFYLKVFRYYLLFAKIFLVILPGINISKQDDVNPNKQEK